MCLQLIESHTGIVNLAWVNQSCLTTVIWLRAECGNTKPGRSRNSGVGWRSMVQGGVV